MILVLPSKPDDVDPNNPVFSPMKPLHKPRYLLILLVRLEFVPLEAVDFDTLLDLGESHDREVQGNAKGDLVLRDVEVFLGNDLDEVGEE